MGFSFVGLAIHDPDPTAIRLPAGNAGSEMLVSIGNALVVFLAKFVFVRVRIGIAAAPELFDKPFALVVGRKFLESFALFFGDDVGDVFLEPIFVSLFQFRLDVAFTLRRILALVVGLFLLRQIGRAHV